METWVIITVAAAFFQNVRSTLQKYLKGRIGTSGATFVRFGFGLPFAFLFLSQITAQALLIHLFSYRNFAVGTAYSRTEPAQAALFGLIFLSETVSWTVLLAIAISVAGVMLISIARTERNPGALIGSLSSRTVAIGLCSGSFFGLSAVAYRGASLSLGGPNFLVQGAVMLFTFASTVFVFREKINRLEIFGCLAIVGGILLLLLT